MQPLTPGESSDTRPNLVLVPRSSEEARLTALEAVILRATLEQQIQRDPTVASQIAAAQVASREFSHYGFFIYLVIPDSAPAAAPGVLERGTGNANIGFRNSDALPLATVTFSTAGRLELLEAFPVAGDGWPAEECKRLLQAPLTAVYIISETGKDYAASTS